MCLIFYFDMLYKICHLIVYLYKMMRYYYEKLNIKDEN